MNLHTKDICGGLNLSLEERTNLVRNRGKKKPFFLGISIPTINEVLPYVLSDDLLKKQLHTIGETCDRFVEELHFYSSDPIINGKHQRLIDC